MAPKDSQPTMQQYANPYLACMVCLNRAVGYVETKEGPTWPCGDVAEVVSLCPTWNPVDGCSCDPVDHKLPTEGVRDRKKIKKVEDPPPVDPGPTDPPVDPPVKDPKDPKEPK